VKNEMNDSKKNVRTYNPLYYSVRIHHAETDKPVGTGIVVSTTGEIITCAHVIRDAGVDPYIIDGQEIGVQFVHAHGVRDEKKATVSACFPQYEDDIVVLKLIDGQSPLGPELIPALGKAEASRLNQFVSYGFSPLGKHEAAYAQGTILGCEPCPEDGSLKAGMVQLQSSQIDEGMSGAGVLDRERNLVIGIISETLYPDASTKHRDTGWAVNARVLTFEPFNLPISDEPSPKKPAPEPKIDIEEVRKAVLAVPGIAWNNAPALLVEWVGREQLLKELTDDWIDPDTRVTGLIGFGGEGKSSIARRWVDDVLANEKCKPDGVFWWGFYAKPSVDEFFEVALKYMSGGTIDPSKLPSAGAKAQVIGAMLGAGRYLFVLDGLEVLQHQKGDQYGLLQSKNLLNFLECFGGSGVSSFCLITSRAPILDLMNYTPYLHRNVNRLLTEDGNRLLRKVGIKGRNEELDKVVSDWDGHALTLSLLGSFIAEKCDGDLSKAADIDLPEMGENRYKRVHRVLLRYDKHLDDAEHAFMMLFSAFRIPVVELAFDIVFRAKTKAPSLNVPVAKLSKKKFKTMIDRLLTYRIIRYDSYDKSYTAHPLIRNHYLVRLTRGKLSQTKNTHEQIKDYYLEMAGETPPNPSLHDLVPLIEAVHHLCSAGNFNEAYIVRYRIYHGNRNYIFWELAAYPTALRMLLDFFPNGDMKRKPLINDMDAQYKIYNDIGFSLMGMGDLEKALMPYKLALKIAMELHDWNNVCATNNNLAEIRLRMGSLKGSISAAKETLKSTNKPGYNPFTHFESHALSWYALALYLQGNLEDAGEMFEKAQNSQIKTDPGVKYLYGLSGNNFADFLIRVGKLNYAQNITLENSHICKQEGWPDHLSQCYRVLGDIETNTNNNKSALNWYNAATKIAISITRRDVLIEALLARGRFYAKHMVDAESAYNDLKEALEYATGGGYRIYEADIRIALGWVYQSKRNRIKKDIERARAEVRRGLTMSEEMGYHWGKVDGMEVMKKVNNAN
jgi:tetratricopeptide (TPR) repeat protein